MSEERQKNQEQLALPFAGGSEAPLGELEGGEALRVRREAEDPAGNRRMMEEVCKRENRREALKRVRGNQGSPGIDGMTVDEIPEYLEQHWPAIREQLLSGTYEPKPVKRVEIPKPEGGVRKLGIPTVLDRLVQQMVQQVLQKQWDPTFSEYSYGFRPERSAQQAVAQAQEYIAEGYGWCVDFDLEKFLDRVPYCPLVHESCSKSAGC
jgi:RNA-directed DNA polymerase